MATATTQERELLVAARAGDENAFRRLLRGDRIAEITSFITCAIAGRDREYYARYPEQALDPARLAAFERFGLPARLD